MRVGLEPTPARRASITRIAAEAGAGFAVWFCLGPCANRLRRPPMLCSSQDAGFERPTRTLHRCRHENLDVFGRHDEFPFRMAGLLPPPMQSD